MNRLLRVALASLLAAVTTLALGATRYVTDELRISVRTGAGNQYRIVEVVDSGTRLETLETTGEWAQVRTPDGNTGWVRSQYLAEEPIAAQRLETLRGELQSARTRIEELKQSLDELRAENDSLRAQNESVSAELESAREKLSRAQAGLRMEEQNARLKEQTQRLERRLAELQEETQRLMDQSRQEWFLIGGGVLFGGILFGIVVTRIPWRRNRRDRLF